MLSIPCGVNEFGLKLTVNIVKSTIKTHPIIPTGIRTRMGFYLCKEVDEVCKILEETGDSICYNLLIADKERIIGLEINPYNRPKTETLNWIVRSNTFVTESLQQYLYRRNYSKKRQRIAEQIISQEYNGGLNELQLIKILSKRPVISRVNTVAFFTDKHFGIGRPNLNRLGEVPNFLR
jgi:predicted choloylglycine hydrolase